MADGIRRTESGSLNQYAVPMQGMKPSISVTTLVRHDSKESFQEEIHKRRMSQHITENMVLEHVGSDIDEIYIRQKQVLGTGISTVRSCVHRSTGRRFALKTVNKLNLKPKQLKLLGQEIRIMASLDHPNIVRLYETFENAEEIYLVMELLSGGDLLERLTTVGHQLTEELTLRLIQGIVGAVRYCHDNGIAHRDLKLENFVFETQAANSTLKMIDFGLSARITPGELLTDALGSAYYVAPEVLEKRYNEKCDIWSIGVIAYMLLTGVPPFDGENDRDVINSVRVGVASYPPDLFGDISDNAVDFIRKCLTYDHTKRPSAEDCQNHPWFNALVSERMRQPLPTTMLGRLKAYRQKGALHKLCSEAVAYALSPEELQSLRAEFNKFDTDASGSISLDELRRVFVTNGSLTYDEVTDIFKGIDIEGSGTIQFRELIAAMLSSSSQNEDSLKLAFDRMANHKDHITYQDIRDLLGKDYTDNDAERMLLELDFDRNSLITFNDFKKIMRGTQKAQLTTVKSKSKDPVRRGSLGNARPQSPSKTTVRSTPLGSASPLGNKKMVNLLPDPKVIAASPSQVRPTAPSAPRAAPSGVSTPLSGRKMVNVIPDGAGYGSSMIGAGYNSGAGNSTPGRNIVAGNSTPGRGNSTPGGGKRMMNLLPDPILMRQNSEQQQQALPPIQSQINSQMGFIASLFKH